MSKKAGILFDYNGVIVNDEHLHEQTITQTVGERGVTIDHTIFNRYCLGRSDRATFANLQEVFPALQTTRVEQLIRRKVELYENLMQKHSIVVPHIARTLSALHEHFSMAIVTGTLDEEIEPLLAKENIGQFFKDVITANDITQSKPDPEGYLKGVAALKLPREKIVVIEDTPIGIQAAKSAGLACIAVCHTVTAEHLSQADLIVKMVNEITPEIVWSILE